MNRIKILFVTIIAALSFISCSEDEPAQMLWDVSAAPVENIKAVFDPHFYSQIQITANGNKGEATLNCTNYKILVLDGFKNENGEYVDSDCNFTAKLTEPDIVKITLGKMPDGFKETNSFLYIGGTDGKNSVTTTISVVRKPSDK